MARHAQKQPITTARDAQVFAEVVVRIRRSTTTVAQVVACSPADVKNVDLAKVHRLFSLWGIYSVLHRPISALFRATQTFVAPKI